MSKPRSEPEERQPHSPHSEQRHPLRTCTPALLAKATHAPGKTCGSQKQAVQLEPLKIASRENVPTWCPVPGRARGRAAMAQMPQSRCCDGDTGHTPQLQGPGSVVCRSLGGGGGDTGASLHSVPPPPPRLPSVFTWSAAAQGETGPPLRGPPPASLCLARRARVRSGCQGLVPAPI